MKKFKVLDIDWFDCIICSHIRASVCSCLGYVLHVTVFMHMYNFVDMWRIFLISQPYMLYLIFMSIATALYVRFYKFCTLIAMLCSYMYMGYCGSDLYFQLRRRIFIFLFTRIPLCSKSAQVLWPNFVPSSVKCPRLWCEISNTDELLFIGLKCDQWDKTCMRVFNTKDRFRSNPQMMVKLHVPRQAT